MLSGNLVNAVPVFNNSLNNLYQSCDEPYDQIEQNVISITNGFLPDRYPETRVDQAFGISHELESAIERAVEARAKIAELVPQYMMAIERGMKPSEDVVWRVGEISRRQKGQVLRRRVGEISRRKTGN